MTAAMEEEMLKQQRIHEVWWRCRHKILNGAGGLYSLPGEVIGAEIAEALLHAAYERMLAAQAQQQIVLRA